MKELLALVHMLKKWRVYLMGNRVQVLTDNASLTWLMTQKQLSNRQARWLQLIQTYDLDIKYIKGSINLVADALSRRFVESNTFTVNNNDFKQTIKQQLIKDSYFKDIVECINGMCKDDKIKSSSKWFIMKDGLLYLNDKKDLRICIPRSMVVQILHEVHDSPTGGHPGIERTYLTLKQYYFWPKMHHMIKQYITGCESCQLNKVSNMKPQGLFNPIEIPTQRWQVISMDFITDLPKSDKFNMIMVVVDRLTKRVRLIPSCTSATATDVANLFVDYIFRDFGLPQKIISDRDARFTSKFWKALMKRIGTKVALSTAFHPQTDGITERTNRTIEEALRHYISYKQDNWNKYLPLIEFSINNTVNTTTSYTPFMMDIGRNPVTPLSLLCDNEEASQFADRINQVIDVASQKIREAQSSQGNLLQ